MRFEGKLTFAGTVRIDASFVGTIVTNDVLVVGEAARIDATITCGTIVVHGEVNGNILAKTGVEIHGSGKVRGDLCSCFASMRGGGRSASDARATTGSIEACARSGT